MNNKKKYIHVQYNYFLNIFYPRLIELLVAQPVDTEGQLYFLNVVDGSYSNSLFRFWGSTKLLSIGATLFHIPTSNTLSIPKFFQILSFIPSLPSSLAILKRIWYYSSLWFWFTFPYLLRMLTSFHRLNNYLCIPLEKCLYKSFDHFWVVLFEFLDKKWMKSSLFFITYAFGISEK